MSGVGIDGDHASMRVTYCIMVGRITCTSLYNMKIRICGQEEGLVIVARRKLFQWWQPGESCCNGCSQVRAVAMVAARRELLQWLF